jgi:hypothetical protein
MLRLQIRILDYAIAWIFNFCSSYWSNTELCLGVGCLANFAFAANGALEGQFGIHYKSCIPLSVQQVLDCTDDDAGCGGKFKIV